MCSIFGVAAAGLIFIIKNCYKIAFYVCNMTIISLSICIFFRSLQFNWREKYVYDINTAAKDQLISRYAAFSLGGHNGTAKWKWTLRLWNNLGVFLLIFFFFFPRSNRDLCTFIRHRLLCRARRVYRRSESRHMIMVALRYAKSPPILRRAFVLLKRFGS